MRFKSFCYAGVLYGASVLAHNDAAQAPSSKMQLRYSAEDISVNRPVSIPKSVLDTLVRDPLVRSELETEHIPSERIPTFWFSASQIQLGSGSTPDLLVVSEGPLRGANVATFWIFLNTSNGYDLALQTMAHDFVIKTSRSKGYRVLESLSATADKVTTVIYRYNGQRYVQSQTALEGIR